MLIKFGGGQPKLFPDWLNGSAPPILHLSGIPGQMLLKPTAYGVAGEPGARIPLGLNDSCGHPGLLEQVAVITNKTRLCASYPNRYPSLLTAGVSGS